MSTSTRVDFHCHTSFSDGSLTPRELAERLATDGVRYAALTDHDTLSGQDAFHRAAGRRGIGYVTGVEITTQYEGREAHLLAYGFDPEHPGLREALRAVRRGKPPSAQNVTAAMRGRAENESNGETRPFPGGKIEISEAIELVHEAGGKAFLAHPLTLEPDPTRLPGVLSALQQAGLDGIEAIYGPYTDVQRDRLCQAADEFGLLVSAGADRHDRPRRGRSDFGVEMPDARWKQFRDAVCCGPDDRETLVASDSDQPRLRMKRRHFLLHVLLPTLLAILLFGGAIFGVLLPAFERSLLERKREAIRELTRSAWSILSAYHEDVQAGNLPLEEAQERAAQSVGELRYGPESKDYFWIQDMEPRIIMHPWRPDLVGENVSDFTDQRGVRIFVKFAELVREQGGGYVDYVWQWKDDPQRFEPKESYVMGFEPWGWIIGTGLYTEDVQAEISRIEAGLARISLAITGFVVLLLLYVLRQGVKLERSRSEAEEGLRQSTARYRSLVEAHNEGTLLVQDGRLTYANPMMLEIAGCGQDELRLLDLEDLLPRTPENEAAWTALDHVREGEATQRSFEGVIHRRDGGETECVFAASRMAEGLILLVTPVAEAPAQSLQIEGVAEMAETAPVGLLRARATPQGSIVRHNHAAGPLLEVARDASPDQPLSMRDLFPEPDAWQEFLKEARAEGGAERLLRISTDEPRNLTLSLRAATVRDERGDVRYLDCILEDVTAR
ncbi:MAG: cache domain-containing protein, partial [Armatimonadota bacterium]